jgi:hypothetical protein
MGATSRRADLFLDPVEDPRAGGTRLGDERATLMEYLRGQRLTLELKCSGLGAEQLARRSVEPSTLSLLGLVRHMADVERGWFRAVMAQQDAPKRYTSPTNRDGDFDDAVADPAVVAEAFAAWREEGAFTDRFVAEAPNLDVTGLNAWDDSQISLREVLVHNDRGVRPPQWARGPAARAHRRPNRPVGQRIELRRRSTDPAHRNEKTSRTSGMEISQTTVVVTSPPSWVRHRQSR